MLVQAAQTQGRTGRLVGVDLTPAMLRRAAEEIARRSIHAELRLMDAQALEFDDSSFDHVFCAFALAMLDDPAGALAGFYRVLRPGRQLALANAFGWFHQHGDRLRWGGDVLASFGVAKAVQPPDLDIAHLEQIVRGAGFIDVRRIEERLLEFLQAVWLYGGQELPVGMRARPRPPLGRIHGRVVAPVVEGGYTRRCRGADGRIELSVTAHLTYATRPAD